MQRAKRTALMIRDFKICCLLTMRKYVKIPFLGLALKERWYVICSASLSDFFEIYSLNYNITSILGREIYIL